MRKLQAGDTRLSPSSGTTLRACEQKWYYYKVEGREYDSDYDEGNNLMIGSAFHWVIEQTEHRWPKSIVTLLKKYSLEDERFTREFYPLLIGMVWSYTQYFESTGYEIAAIEHKLEDEDFLGYVDAILVDPENKDWWISDNKTWGYFSPSQAGQLANHIQLNLYAAFAPMIADDLGLKLAKFRGCRIMATTKPKNKRGKMTEKEYANKMKEWCMTWDIEIPRKVLRPQHHLMAHKELHDKSLELREGTREPSRNYDYCMSYFSPCEYWSGCHGCNFSEGADQVVVRGGQ